MSQHDPEKLKAFWEYMGAWNSLAKALVAGNAAGLAYALSNIAPEKYQVGTFIRIFSVGVVCGGLYLFILTILKAEVTTAIVSRERPGPTIRGKIIELLGHVGMWGSAAAFVSGVALCAYRFAYL